MSKPSETAPLVVLFNGPPGSGKDTASNAAADRYDSNHQEKFARPVKEGCHGMFGITDSAGRVVKHDHFESVKNIPNPEFMDMSPREAYIWYSEVVMKPQFGQDIFGRLAIRNMREWVARFETRSHFMRRQPMILVSDSGFVCEAAPVAEAFGLDNILLVRIYREGHTFEGDSRSYIELPGVKTVEVRNHASQETFGESIRALIEDWKDGAL